MTTKKKILIFASLNGSNFEAIVHFLRSKDAGIEIELLADRNCPAIKRALDLGIKHYLVEFDNIYNFLSEKNDYDLFVLAGFMRLLPENVLNFGTFINIHPSLLPEFPGKNSILRAYQEGVKLTGVTVHYVNKDVDAGEIILQEKCSIEDDDTPLSLEEKIHKIEHRIYPKVIFDLLCQNEGAKYNILVLGSGAREHAIAKNILKSPLLNKLYLADANDGFKDLGQTIEYCDFYDLAKKSKKLGIDVLIVGPEAPLAAGITDIFKEAGISVFGADRHWTQLESSKLFAKEFMKKNSINTSPYIAIDRNTDIAKALSCFMCPPVIKADGLAMGKGVYIPKTFEDAENAIIEFLNGKYGEASNLIVAEEFLKGEELSIMSLWDGNKLLSFPPARDYKKLLNNDLGPNTGGMGAYCPVGLSGRQKETLLDYLKKLEDALKFEKADFSGVIYSGLMLVKDEIFVLEYNMRFGDPEIQALLQILETDLLSIIINCVFEKLHLCDLKFKNECSYCIVLASEGYPDKPKKGARINLNNVQAKYGTDIFYANVKEHNNELFSNGGRVLNVVKSGKDALKCIYGAINEIEFAGKIYRDDIGR